MISLVFSDPNLPLEEDSIILVREEGRHEAICSAEGYLESMAIEVAPKVSVKIFKYSGKSFEIKALAMFLAAERFLTNKNLLRDSDFSSEMWYNTGASGL